MKVNRRDLLKAGVTVLGTGALAGVAGGQDTDVDFERYCAFKGPTDTRDLLEPKGCAYVYLDEGDGSVYISRQDEAGWSRFTGAGGGALTWDATDLDNGTDNGVVHETNQDVDGDGTIEPTSYTNASEIRKGDPAAAPLFASDLLAWYPLQESTGGTAYDFSGNNYDATVNGATQAGGNNIVRTPTYSFDGVDDYLNSSAFSGGVYTASFWINPDKTFDSDDDGSFNYECIFGDDVAQFFIGDATSKATGETMLLINGGEQTVAYEKIIGGAWQHICIIWNGSGYDIYFDRQEISTDDVSDGGSSLFNLSHLVLGARISNSDGYYDGDIADFRVYNRALSASEIQEIYDVFGGESSHETISKGPAPSSSPTIEFADVSVPGDSTAFVDVLEDTTGDGTADTVVDTIALVDGQTTYTASNVTQDEEIALRPRISPTSDLTDGATVVVDVEVSA